MFTGLRRIKEKKLIEKKAQAEREERMRTSHERALEKCKKGEHEWVYDTEIQGDGDPNVEGYIQIVRATCRVCGESETTIEPYDKSDEQDT
jgi:hypothetical protein